jgi:hypothetical protein
MKNEIENRRAAEYRERANLVASVRETDVRLALEEGNAKYAVISYLERQSEAIAERRTLEGHRAYLRRLAMSRREQQPLIPFFTEAIGANQTLVDELGKTIAAIRREYQNPVF